MTTTHATDADTEVLDQNQQDDADQANELEARKARGDFIAPPAGTTPAEPQDVAGEAGDELGDDTGRGTQTIPRARFNEVNEQRKEYLRQLEDTQRELARLRGQPGGGDAAPARAAAEAPIDVDELEKGYMEALLDGDTKTAFALRRQINQHNEANAFQRYAEYEASRQSEVVTQQQITQTLADHPWLDTDEGAVALDLILASTQAKMQAGMPKHQALADAVNTIAPRFAPANTPSRDLPSAQRHSDTRLANAMKRNAADAMLQPTAVQAGIGNRAQAAKLDIDNLTDEEYAALPPAERKKLRGD